MKNLIFIILVSIFISGCALIGKNYIISDYYKKEYKSVDINIPADVYIDSVYKGTTPCVIKVKPNLKSQIVTFKFKNGEVKSYTLDKAISPFFYLNLLCPVGFIIDAHTGDIFDIKNIE